MWISGYHSVKAYLDYQSEQIKVLYLMSNNAHAKAIAPLAKEKGISIQWVNHIEIKKRQCLSQGMGALCTPYQYVEEHALASLLTPTGIILILDQVQDPNNLGACIRSADAAKVDCLIIAKDKAAAVTEAVAKSAAGAIATVPILRATNLARIIEKLKALGVWVYGTAIDDKASSLYSTQFPKKPIALVLGSEGSGLRQLVKKTCDELVMIPMYGSVQSLNVSVATALCLYEVRRQQQTTST